MGFGWRVSPSPAPPPEPAAAAPHDMLALGAVLALLFLPAVTKSRSGGVNLAIYFALGTAVYKNVEGWEALDACYFMVVTATTVGYGDISPQTPEGRAFTAVYALIGIATIIQEFSPFVDMVLGMLDRLVVACVAAESDVARCFRAASVPSLLFAVGAVSGWLQGETWEDSLYYSMISMTTVGYGDFTPKGALQKCFAIIFLPLSTTALAKGISMWMAVAIP